MRDLVMRLHQNKALLASFDVFESRRSSCDQARRKANYLSVKSSELSKIREEAKVAFGSMSEVIHDACATARGRQLCTTIQ